MILSHSAVYDMFGRSIRDILPHICGVVTIFCAKVEKELSDICASILQLLDEHLIPTASTGESKVFYLKMKGDYHRYLAEFKTGADRKEAAEHTLLAYKAAQVHHACKCIGYILILCKFLHAG